MAIGETCFGCGIAGAVAVAKARTREQIAIAWRRTALLSGRRLANPQNFESIGTTRT
jgi:hypothetical protein